MIIDDEQIVVAHAGRGNEAASAVGVNLAGWFHHCSTAMVHAHGCCWGKGSLALLGSGLTVGALVHLVDLKFWQFWSRWP